MSLLMNSRNPFNPQVRSFCHRLWTYYHKEKAGMLHKRLLEMEIESKLKEKIYNTGFVGDAYEDASEDREKRRRTDVTNEMESGQSTMFSQVSSSSDTEIKKSLLQEQPNEIRFLNETSSKNVNASMVQLNQEVKWKVGELDLLQRFYDFRSKPQSQFSLAIDDIADITFGSEFVLELTQEERKSANVCSFTEPSVEERWPTLQPILSRICPSSNTDNTYDTMVAALKDEDHHDPLVMFLENVAFSYSHYFTFSDELPHTLGEREGFGFLTWTFIRGALTLVGIPSRCFELPIVGSKERKNHGRDLSVEAEVQASMADAVALSEGHQIYLAEAGLIHNPKLDKEPQDKFKLARCLRDSWNSQIRSIARESIPPTGLTVFGSTSFRDETKFLALDYVGTYRLRQMGRMLIPLRKSHFAKRVEACVIMSLRFALNIREEIVRRSCLSVADEDLLEHCEAIPKTRSTPTKDKKRRMSQIF
ncbi:hypothetical protein FBU30_011181 [Linnemannia zychae]|nr:hypothetical protein FBU30_011181 [Linnemannia zychae]